MNVEEIQKQLAIIGEKAYHNNRYSLSIKIPNISEIQLYNNRSFIDTLNFFVVDSNLPGLKVTVKEAIHLGIIKHAMKNQTIDAISILFYETKDQILRKFFVDWINAVVPQNGKGKAIQYYPNEYSTTGVFKLDKLEAYDKSINIYGMVPVVVGDFALSHNASNNLGTFSVSFKVKGCEYE